MDYTNETAIFILTVEDVQQVAKDSLDRELTQKEIEFVEDHVEEYIPWFDEIQECIEAFPK